MRSPLARAMLLALALLAGIAAPALAHGMKVFATVEGDTVSGYGFFIGGGRPADSPVTATDEAGTVLFQGRTDAEGRFSFTLPGPVQGAVSVTIDSGGGHVASIRLAADRFGGLQASAPAAATEPPPKAAPSAVPAPGLTAEALAAMIEQRVERAVSRQIRPLLEAQAEAEARIRLRDVVGGLGMIAGLVGIGLWAYGRRRAAPRG